MCKYIAMMATLIMSLQSQAIFVHLTTHVNNYAQDGKIEFHELYYLLEAIRDRGITNAGITSDCEAIADIHMSLGLLHEEDTEEGTIELVNPSEHHFKSLEPIIENCGFLDSSKDNLEAKIDTSLDQIVITDSSSLIHGNFPAGVRVLANNLTKLPIERRSFYRARDSQWSDKSSNISLDIQDMQAGDQIRVWVEDMYRTTISERIITVTGPTDTRKPVLNRHWLQLKRHGETQYLLENYTRFFSVGEPNLTVYVYSYTEDDLGRRFRTYQTNFQLNQYGQLNSSPILSKEHGYDYELMTYDYVKNQWESLGELYGLEVDYIDPDNVSLLSTVDDAFAQQDYAKFSGPLFDENGANFGDVAQGWISNCFFAGALRAIAAFYPEQLQNEIVKNNNDGTYSVFFNEVDIEKWKFTGNKEEVRIQPYFPATNDGQALYMQGTPKGPFQMELWGPLIEKAYSIFYPKIKKTVEQNTYDRIGGAGAQHFSTEVMSYIVGGKSSYQIVSTIETLADFEDLIIRALSNQDTKTVVFLDSGSWKFPKLRFNTENIASDHQYLVLGHDSLTGLFKVTNPWGQYEPVQDGADDGEFWVDAEKLYRTMQVVHFHFEEK